MSWMSKTKIFIVIAKDATGSFERDPDDDIAGVFTTKPPAFKLKNKINKMELDEAEVYEFELNKIYYEEDELDV